MLVIGTDLFFSTISFNCQTELRLVWRHHSGLLGLAKTPRVRLCSAPALPPPIMMDRSTQQK